jgi:histidinol-phosphatase (PHP family)
MEGKYMRDVHIHIERGPYTKEWIAQFVDQAQKTGLDEIYLLEHSHRFTEFLPMYDSACKYSDYQNAWIRKRCELSIVKYQKLIREMRKCDFPVAIKWGLEICYFPGCERLVSDILGSFDFDFSVASIHWIDGFGFDHKPEFWQGIDVDAAYRRYYELMMQLVSSNLFSGVAHPDSIKCFHKYPQYDLTDTYIALADKLKAHNVYAEQSAGLALNYGFEEMGMNANMRKIFVDKGVDMRFASDAHKPEDVGAHIAEREVQMSEV